MSATQYAHIEINDRGLAIVAGTRTKVLDIVLDRMAYAWDADEIQRQHPHLTLGQVHSALAYYYDHVNEVDRTIEEQLRQTDEFFASMGDSPLRLKLQRIKAERRKAQ